MGRKRNPGSIEFSKVFVGIDKELNVADQARKASTSIALLFYRSAVKSALLCSRISSCRTELAANALCL